VVAVVETAKEAAATVARRASTAEAMAVVREMVVQEAMAVVE